MKTVICSQCKNEINAEDVICMYCGCPNIEKEAKEEAIENDMKDIKRVRHTKKDPVTNEEFLDEEIKEENEIELPEEEISNLEENPEKDISNLEENPEEQEEEKPKRGRKKSTTTKTKKATTTTRKRRVKKEETEDEEIKEDKPIELKAEVEKIAEIIKKESMEKPVALKEEMDIDDIINNEKEENNDDNDDVEEMLVETPKSLVEENEEMESDEEELPDEEETVPEVEESKEETAEEKEEVVPETPEEEKEETVPEVEEPKEEETAEEKEETSEEKPVELKEEIPMDEIINEGTSGNKDEPKKEETASNSDENHSVIMEEKVVKTFYSPANIIEETSELILKYETKEEVIRNMMDSFNLPRPQAENYFELAIKTVKTKLDKMSIWGDNVVEEVQLADVKYVNYVNQSLRKTRDVEELAKELVKEYTELDLDTALVIADQVKKKFMIKIGIIGCIVILILLILLLIIF